MVLRSPCVLVPGLCCALLSAAFVAPARTDEPSLAEEMPRIPAVEPADALKTFAVERGFALQPVAHEPIVSDPVDGAFDAAGRLYVAEMHGYPYSPEVRDMQPE